MGRYFRGRSADEVWQQMSDKFRKSDCTRVQDSRKGSVREMLGVVAEIQEPHQRWVMSRRPAINLALVLAEVVWIVSGRNDLDFLRFWSNSFSNVVGADNQDHGAYGQRLRRHWNIDQLKRGYETLLQDSTSRQVVLQIWDPVSDLPGPDGKPAAANVPCSVNSMLNVRDGQLEWTHIMRSNDLFLGVPHNFVQFTFLQEIMAGWLHVECGSYRHFSNSLHVYERNARDVARSLPQNGLPDNNDDLALGFEESMRVFEALEENIEQIFANQTSPTRIYEIRRHFAAPLAYRNILDVLVAEALRKQGNITLGRRVMSECNNPTYTYLWDKWVSRLAESIVSVQH